MLGDAYPGHSGPHGPEEHIDMNDTTTPTLKAQLHQDLTAAMRARDEVALSSLRQALSAIAVAETAGKELVELSDEAVQGVLAVEVRKHHESADAFAGGGSRRAGHPGNGPRPRSWRPTSLPCSRPSSSRHWWPRRSPTLRRRA